MEVARQIFQFTDPVEYLNYEFELKKIKNSRFSLRGWSRQLGYENPSLLAHILKRERRLTAGFVEKVSDNLKLNSKARRYFEVLVLLQNSKAPEEKLIYSDLLETLRPKSQKETQSLNIEAFRVISEWHHAAVLEMTELKDFKNDPIYISRRLDGEVSPSNVIKAIERLLKLELLEKTKTGGLKRATENTFLFENRIPNDAVRHFHKQMIAKATQAIERQQINERYISGSTVTLHKRDYEKAVEILRQAHKEITNLSCKKDGDELYQFNTQFFRLTKQSEEA